MLEAWFSEVSKVFHDHDIRPENVYNMDETGFQMGQTNKDFVILDSGNSSTWRQQPGSKELITVIECVSATGRSLPPTILFKGKQHQTNWITDNTPNSWYFGTSPNGWTSNLHGLKWLEQWFDPLTTEIAQGRPRILFIDGHDSHIAEQFVGKCIDKNIILLCLPPHTSHVL